MDLATARGRTGMGYEHDGYSVETIFNDRQAAEVAGFAEEWIRDLMFAQTGKRIERPLRLYHLWHESEGVDHDVLCRARNRHRIPPPAISADLLNERLWSVLAGIAPGRYRVWDEGLGWLGFRLVRPARGDGYPPSCKAWGPAKNVVSCWIPVIGTSSDETLALVPGSHRKTYEKYLPTDQKFCKDEYRVANAADLGFVRPELRTTQAIFYHPRTIHTEDVARSDVTRLNLEMRFDPV